jgi:hypothetical protein
VDNTLYYTFSTIAQALAGSVALLGAFVLYRLQGLEREVHSAVSVVAQAWVEDQEMQRKANASDLSDFLIEADARHKQPIKNFAWSNFWAAQLELATKQWAIRSALIQAVKAPLVVSTATMALSVGVLSVVDVLAESHKLSRALLLVGVATFAVCLFLFTRLVLKMLKP